MMKLKLQWPEELMFIRNARLPQKQSTESMDGKVCVITGTTSGVGYQAAISLAKAGAKIVSIVRSPLKAIRVSEELQKIGKHRPDYYIADFRDLQELKEVVQYIIYKYKQIDVLVNNAGVHMTTRKLTKDGHEMAFGVNHLASFMITGLFLKKLVECAPARIIQVNSEGHRFNGLRLDDLTWEKRKYRGLRGYGASKTAQLLTVWEMHDLLDGKGVTINAMHPGAVKSNIGHNNGKIYNWYSRNIIQPLLKKTEIAGDAIYYLASSSELTSVSGRFFNLTNEEIPAKHALDRKLGKLIFQLSKELTGLDKGDYYEI